MAQTISIALKFLLKAAFFICLLAAILGELTGKRRVRSLGVILGPAACALDLLLGRPSSSFASPQYGYATIAGLLILTVGELLLAVPFGQATTYPGMLCLMCGAAVLAVGVSSPSGLQVLHDNSAFSRGRNGQGGAAGTFLGGQPMIQLGGSLRSVYRVPKALWSAVRIPLRVRSAVVPLIASVTPLAIWAMRWEKGTIMQDQRFAPAVAFLTVYAFLTWRALARVGYRAPVVTAGRILRAHAVRRGFLSDRQRLFPTAPSEASSFGSSYTTLSSMRDGVFPPNPSAAHGYGPGSSGVLASSGVSTTAQGDSYTADDIIEETLEEEIEADEEEKTAAALSARGIKKEKRASTAPVAARAAAAERVAKLRAAAIQEAAALEDRGTQLTAVAGAVCLALGQAALALDRLWLSDFVDTELPGAAVQARPPTLNGADTVLATQVELAFSGPTDVLVNPPRDAAAATYLHIIFSCLGAWLMARSVPHTPAVPDVQQATRGPIKGDVLNRMLGPAPAPLLSLDDPCVSPGLSDGPPLRVLILLPGSSGCGADAAELAIYWHMLTKRGHQVIFATKYGWKGKAGWRQAMQNQARALELGGGSKDEGGRGSRKRSSKMAADATADYRRSQIASAQARPPAVAPSSLTGLGPLASREAGSLGLTGDSTQAGACLSCCTSTDDAPRDGRGPDCKSAARASIYGFDDAAESSHGLASPGRGQARQGMGVGQDGSRRGRGGGRAGQGPVDTDGNELPGPDPDVCFSGCSVCGLGIPGLTLAPASTPAPGYPGPAIIAMFAEMSKAQGYKKPLAWAQYRASPSVGQHGDVESGPALESGSGRTSPTLSAVQHMGEGIESSVDPEHFDGLLVVGRHMEWPDRDPDSDGDDEDEGSGLVASDTEGQSAALLRARQRSADRGAGRVHADMQALIRSMWASGKPVAAVGQGVEVLALCRGQDGRPLLAGSDGLPGAAVACTPPSAQLMHASVLAFLACNWRALTHSVLHGSSASYGSAGYGRLYDRVVAAVGDRSRVLTGPHASWWDIQAWMVWLLTGRAASGALVRPQPRTECDTSFTVTSAGHGVSLVTGRGTSDTFAVVQAFTRLLEDSTRAY